MANRRCLHALTRHASALFSTNLRLPSLPLPLPLSKTQPLKPFLAAHIFTTITPSTCPTLVISHRIEKTTMKWVGVARRTNWNWWREYSPGKKKAEAVGIGYKLVGPLEPSDRVFKPYGPVFSVVQVLLFRLLVSFFIGCLWGYWFSVIFLCLDWIAPVQGEQWPMGIRFSLRDWNSTRRMTRWVAIEFAWLPIILRVHLYFVFFFLGGNSMLHC